VAIVGGPGGGGCEGGHGRERLVLRIMAHGVSKGGQLCANKGGRRRLGKLGKRILAQRRLANRILLSDVFLSAALPSVIRMGNKYPYSGALIRG